VGGFSIFTLCGHSSLQRVDTAFMVLNTGTKHAHGNKSCRKHRKRAYKGEEIR